MADGASRPGGDAAKDATPSLPSTNDTSSPTRKESTSGPPSPSSPSRPQKPRLSDTQRLFYQQPATLFNSRPLSPTYDGSMGQLSPAAADRVFPVRSVVSVDPTPTPSVRPDASGGYFGPPGQPGQPRRHSMNQDLPSLRARGSNVEAIQERGEGDKELPPSEWRQTRSGQFSPRPHAATTRQASSFLQETLAGKTDVDSLKSERTTGTTQGGPDGYIPGRAGSFKSMKSEASEMGGLVTARFKHVVTEGGHAVVTGRDGETIQRCEDEPIHIPGAVQGFGLLIALEEQQEGKLVARVVSENSKQIIGYTPKQLFALESFTDILSEEQADNLLDHIDFIREEDADVTTNGPEVFTMSVRGPTRKSAKLWCAMHINDRHPHLVICEFELEDDPMNPLVPVGDATPEPPEDTLNSNPTEEEFNESTQNSSRPLRVLRSARKRKGEAAAMEVFNIMSQVQEQLAAAPNIEKFLKILVGVVKELTGFHRVMIYQFDQSWNGRVVTELVDPRATKDLYKGLNFPASDIPKQARDLYKINKVRMLYDRDQETARLVCRTVEDLEDPLDLTHAYLRAMSPIHIKYLGNMAVRSSMSISINAFQELWGLIACHSYGSKGMRVSFPIRKMCRLVGDSASRNIERLSYASRLQARKLINTVPTQNNPSGYIIASSEDLLKLFDADFGLLSIRDETKILGNLEQSQEALAMLEYLRMRCVTNVMTSQDIKMDFPDLRYAPGFQVIAGLLLVPLSAGGQDFIVFFRKGQLKEVKWAGNPYEKFIKEGTEGYLEPRKSFRTWSEMVVGKCREWTEEEIETAAVLCLVYGKFIEVWRQKEAALQNSQLTRLLLANSAHEVRTPLNAIINYLEIALEGSLDQETRENLAKSHSASKSLIYVINDLLDLTKTEEGGLLIKDEIFELKTTLQEATDMFRGDARRKNISYEVVELPGLPHQVIGDQRRVRQAISNVTANAIQNTTQGGVKVEMYASSRSEKTVEVEICVSDTGTGMSAKKLDALFRELEQVQTEGAGAFDETKPDTNALPDPENKEEGRTLGLGLAVVARIVRNMNGQLRLKSEEGAGSKFVIQIPFDLPDSEPRQLSVEGPDSVGSVTPMAEGQHAALPSTPPNNGEMTLVDASGQRRASSDGKLTRKNSGESMNSKTSLQSFKSGHSNKSSTSVRSGRSEADRLIEAIQEPHRVEGWSGSGDSGKRLTGPSRAGSGGGSSMKRPNLNKRHPTYSGADSGGSPTPSRARSIEVAPVPDHLREQALAQISTHPGEALVEGQGVPIRAVRMHDDGGISPSPVSSTHGYAPSVFSTSLTGSSVAGPPSETGDVNVDNLQVLVAEDDPVNSRIIKKRLERLGHSVHLTVNGEECSSTYCDKTAIFDIVLMDMQMPIVDGLTSAKMIRSFEKSHPTHILSTRASLNGRLPIIAVSASLVESKRQTYIDAGFDGWILKPIDFKRLSIIMEGIVDAQARGENLYRPGVWERGGWFSLGQKDVFAADTRPSEDVPMSGASNEVKAAAGDDAPDVKEESQSRQSEEQIRLLDEQDAKRRLTMSPEQVVQPVAVRQEEQASEEMNEDDLPTPGQE